MTQHLRRLTSRRRDSGASAVEYALIVVGIAALLVVIVYSLGRITKANFSSTCSAWNTADKSSSAC